MYHIMIADSDSMTKLILTRLIHQFDDSAEVYYLEKETDLQFFEKLEMLDLLFFDLTSENKYLLESVKELRRLHPDLFICILSEFESSHITNELQTLRIDKYLKKPVNTREIQLIFQDIKKYSACFPLPSASRLIRNIRNKRFADAYSDIDPTILEIMEKTEDEEALYIELMQLAEYILNQFHGRNQRNILKTWLTLNSAWCRDKELLKIWLYQVTEYIFQENSIGEYRILERFFRFIEENKSEHISLSDIVENCRISQGYLSRIFRGEFTMSVMDYVKLKKIQCVKLKLIFTDSNMSEIAARSGFYDGGHMQRLFQKYEQVSVQEFREKTRS